MSPSAFGLSEEAGGWRVPFNGASPLPSVLHTWVVLSPTLAGGGVGGGFRFNYAWWREGRVYSYVRSHFDVLLGRLGPLVGPGALPCGTHLAQPWTSLSFISRWAGFGGNGRHSVA